MLSWPQIEERIANLRHVHSSLPYIAPEMLGAWKQYAAEILHGIAVEGFGLVPNPKTGNITDERNRG